jgi:hypothetical protein
MLNKTPEKICKPGYGDWARMPIKWANPEIIISRCIISKGDEK